LWKFHDHNIKGICIIERKKDEYAAVAVHIEIENPRARQAIINYWHLTSREKEMFWNFVDTLRGKKL
jgi:hypothetical protein